MRAKNRDEYISEWRSHTSQLIHVALDAGYEMDRFDEIRDSIEEMISRAADNTFGTA